MAAHEHILAAEYAHLRSIGTGVERSIAGAWEATRSFMTSAVELAKEEAAKTPAPAPVPGLQLAERSSKLAALRALHLERGDGEPRADSIAAGIRWLRRAWQAEAKARADWQDEATARAEQPAAMAACERLLAQARAVMLGESELDEAGFAELLAEISSVIDEQEVER